MLAPSSRRTYTVANAARHLSYCLPVRNSITQQTRLELDLLPAVCCTLALDDGLERARQQLPLPPQQPRQLLALLLRHLNAHRGARQLQGRRLRLLALLLLLRAVCALCDMQLPKRSSAGCHLSAAS